MNKLGIGLLAIVLLAVPVLAAELGDAAPALKVEKWLKGGPVDLKAGGEKNIYVIEFWATWCGPCRKSIPHLSELQKKYKDKSVTIVGVSTDSEKTRGSVADFVETMGEKMDYAVALDTKEGDTNKGYMEAFKQNGIPTAFLVQNGKIMWLGHPMEMDEPLEALVAGKFDLKAAQAKLKEARAAEEKSEKLQEALMKYFKLVSTSDKPEGAEKAGAELLDLAGKNGMLLNMLAWEILTSEEIKFRDLKLALKAAKTAFEAEPKSAAIADTYARALWDTGAKKDAVDIQKKAVELAKNDKEMDDDGKAELSKTLEKYEKGAGK
jgi:thiol-disulfide isomerase/thioredoxin